MAIPHGWGVVATVGMLVASNVFMTFAWYWHLRLHLQRAAVAKALVGGIVHEDVESPGLLPDHVE